MNYKKRRISIILVSIVSLSVICAMFTKASADRIQILSEKGNREEMGKIKLLSQVPSGKQIEKISFGKNGTDKIFYSDRFSPYNCTNIDFKNENIISDFIDNNGYSSVYESGNSIYMISTETIKNSDVFSIGIYNTNDNKKEKINIKIDKNKEYYRNLIKFVVHSENIYAIYSDETLKKLTAVRIDPENKKYEVISKYDLGDNVVESGENFSTYDSKNIYIFTYDDTYTQPGMLIYNYDGNKFSDVYKLEKLQNEYAPLLSAIRVNGNSIDMIVQKNENDLYLYKYDRMKNMKFISDKKLPIQSNSLEDSGDGLMYSGSENTAIYGNKLYYIESYNRVYGDKLDSGENFSFSSGYDDKAKLKVYNIDSEEISYECEFRASGIKNPIFIKE